MPSRQDLLSVLRFLIVGGGIALIYIGGTTVGVELLDWLVMPTNIGFYLLSTVLGYLANYFWTFGSTAVHGTAFTKYIIVAGGGFLLNTVFVALASVVGSVPVMISTTLFTTSWAVISFLLQRNFIYR